MVQASTRRPWTGLGVAAAVVLVLVGGLTVLAGRRGEPPASGVGSHVLPTSLPNASVGPTDLSGGGLRLVSITSTANNDVLEYASDSLDLSISVDRRPTTESTASRVEVRNGETASVALADDGGRLRWNAPDGSAVAIEWVGAVIGGVDGIVDVVDGLVLVDAATWNTAIEFGGFTKDRALLRRRVGAFDVLIDGDLQSGMSLRVDIAGSYQRLTPSPCLVLGPGESGEQWAVVSRLPSGTAAITWSDGSVDDVEISPFVAGSNFGIGVVERSAADMEELPTGDCELAS